jgi:hypothetical protein
VEIRGISAASQDGQEISKAGLKIIRDISAAILEIFEPSEDVLEMTGDFWQMTALNLSLV